jgi:hypothetical protein
LGFYQYLEHAARALVAADQHTANWQSGPSKVVESLQVVSL